MTTGYLFLAFFLIWAGVAGYLWRLASLRAALERRVERLECGPGQEIKHD